MKLTKTLGAAIVATTVAGAFGFAVAQTSTTDNGTTMQSPATPTNPNGPSTGMGANGTSGDPAAAGYNTPSGATSTDSTSTPPSGELAARADRN